MSIINIQTANVTVELTAPSGKPEIASYEVSVVGASASQVYTISPSVSRLRCTITDLSAYTSHTLRWVGCLPGTAFCSFNHETGLRTREIGKFLEYLLAKALGRHTLNEHRLRGDLT